MSDFKRFRDGFIGPVIILFVISLLITGAVASTYVYTAPKIAEVEIKAADEARQEVLPAADSFTKCGIDLPEGVDEAYSADNGAGFVFRAGAKGFGGIVPFMIGLDADGNVVGIKMLENDETPGLGSKVGDKAYLEQYYGGVAPDGIDGISGATKTSNALKGALALAKEAFERVKA